MRVLTKLGRALMLTLAIVVGAAAVAATVTQTPWFKQWLRGFIVRQVNEHFNATLSIDRLRGNLFSGIELEDVALSMNGHVVISIERVRASYSVKEIVSKGIVISRVGVTRPVVAMRRDDEGWELGHLIKRSNDQGGHPRPVSIEHLDITGGSFSIDASTRGIADRTPDEELSVSSARSFEQLEGTLSLRYEPDHFTFDIAHLSLLGSSPAVAVSDLTGVVALRYDDLVLTKLLVRTTDTTLSVDGEVRNYRRAPVFALQVAGDPLSLPEIGRVVPAIREIRLTPRVKVTLEGPLEQLTTGFDIRSTAGDISGQGVAGLGATGRSFAGRVSLRHLDLAPFLAESTEKSDIVADVALDVRAANDWRLEALTGTVSVRAARIQARGYLVEGVTASARLAGRHVAVDARVHAYGADVSTLGSVVLPAIREGATAFDLKGHASGVDLARLPPAMRVPPATSNLTTAYHITGVVPRHAGIHIAGETSLESSTVAGTTIAAGATVGFGYRPGDLQYQADMTVSDLDLQRIGHEFDVHALDDSRYHSAINGHVAGHVHGTALDTMELSATGTLRESTVLGGHYPEMAFDTTISGDTLRVKANGSVAELDPAVPLRNAAAAGKVTGTVDADVVFAHLSSGVDLNSVEVDATAELGPSSLGDVRLDRASVTGDYHHAVVDIQTLELAGADVVASGSGTLALNDTDESGFWIHAEATSLDRVSGLAKRPFSGIGVIDATVTGNTQEFRAAGTLSGGALKYNGVDALTASAEFTAKVPGLAWDHTSVNATSRATFLNISGVQINELTAKTEYADQRIAFDVQAAQPRRTLGALGSLVFRADDREVRLERLRLQTQGLSWETSPGHEPVITFGQDVIAVRDLQLTDRDQLISTEGVFGRAGEKLTVRLENVDMAAIDAVLLRAPQLSGRLSATSTITGVTESPEVTADFHVERGKFRDVAYDSLGGTIKYDNHGLTVDARLEQNASQWLTAKGHVPLAAFNPKPRTDDDQFDLHVESSTVDLGLVQGVTTALTNVTGTVQATVDLTGPVEEPRLAGLVTVQRGAFKVEDTGVAYTSLDGRIELLPDRIHIGELRLLDNQKRPLTISGDLSVHAFQVGDVNLGFKAKDFKVLDNEFGNLRVDSDLRLAGSFAHPRLEGDLHIATGSVNLDPILARVGSSPYSTTAVDATDDAAKGGEPSGGFDAIQAAIHVTIPNDLVVKASDLKVSSGPIGLGAVNLTLGGDLNIAKSPGVPMTLVGAVTTVRGFYDFQGRRFTILRDGTVRFTGEEVNRLDPLLDVSAERVIQAVTARVNVRGRMKRPDIQLSSTPPLEPSDILALIVFNQPLNQLGEGAQLTLAQRAGTMAAGAVTGPLTSSIASALNLDQFDLSLAPDSLSMAELTIGQQLGENLYVKVQQGIGDHSQTNVILEYELAKWLRLQTNVLEGSSTQEQLFQRVQSTGLDLVFSFAFK